MDTKRVNGPSDPISTTVDCVFTKKVSYHVEVPSTGLALTNVLIATQLPAVSYQYRIQKLSCYAPATAEASLQVGDQQSDEAIFIDYGTQGSIRPQIHLRPSWELRNKWFEKATVETFYQIHATGGGTAPSMTTVIIQLTLEIRLDVTAPLFRTHVQLVKSRAYAPEEGYDEPDFEAISRQRDTPTSGLYVCPARRTRSRQQSRGNDPTVVSE
jgi:hypothetical protein